MNLDQKLSAIMGGAAPLDLDPKYGFAAGPAMDVDPRGDLPPIDCYDIPDHLEADSIAAAPNWTSKTSKNFRPVPIDDVEATAGGAWLIKRLVPARGLAVIVGAPKSRKSFFAADMLFTVARDEAYGGRGVLGGPVFYLVGEGQTGFKRRLVAMRRHAQVEGKGIPFYMVENVPDLGSEETDVAQLLEEIDAFRGEHQIGPPRAVVLDTLARSMGDGDENTAGGMGRFVERCALIERALGCVVIVIHHTGKDSSKGGRGSNSLNGAADVTLIVEKSDAYSTVRVEEMKDGPEGQEWRFRLIPFDIFETSDTPSETTNETSTCVVELLSSPSQTKPKTKPAAQSVKGVPGDLLKVIRHAIDEAGEVNIDSKAAPQGIRAVSRDNLKRYCATMSWQDQDEKPDSFRTMLNKTLSTLRAADHIGFDKRWVWTIQ